MEDFEDNFFSESELTDLVLRFEQMVNDGSSSYYEVDDLETLLEHYIIHQRLELAFKVLETAHSQHPANRQLTIKEAELLSLTDKHSEALTLLKDIEIFEHFNPEFHLTRASIWSQIGKYENAIKSLMKALECSNDDLDVIYLNIAIEHQNLEQYQQAVDFLLKALAINPDQEDAIYELAYCYELTRKYDEAVVAFKKIIDQTPYNGHAWFNLGAAYQALGEMEKALTAFDYVIVIDDEFHAAYFNKANVLVRIERHGEAIDLYKKALSFDILDSLIYFYIGDCYDHIDDPKNALIYFEKSIKKDEAMAESWIGASSALDELGRELEALEYANKAIKLDPENGDYHCFLAGLQMKYDLLFDSVASFERAISFGYVQEDLWEDYTQLCLTMKNYSAAEDVIERGRLEFPDNQLLALYDCIVLYYQGQEEIAFEKLVEILISAPELMEEFVLFYPKAVESADLQFLIHSLSHKN